MGRLFLRIFFWFWLASSSLLLVFVASVLLVRPDALVSWRTMGQSAMLYVGRQVADAYERGGAPAAQRVIDDVARSARVRVWLYAADGRALGDAAPVGRADGLVARVLASDETERAGDGTFLLARRVSSSSGASYVLVWRSPLRSRMSVPIDPVPFSLRILALVATGGVVCWWLTWHLTRPIRTLRRAARQFSGGDLAVRVSGTRELRRGDELSDLARDFDDMAGRVQELVVAQQQLLADISHELRSPLARLSLALDLARRRLGETVPEHDRIAREIQRLNELIEQLLTLARLHGQSRQAQTDRIDLRALVHDVAQDARFEAEAAGRRVVVARDCEIGLRGSRALLRSAVENVIRNAVRHTPEHSEVAIHMERDDTSRRAAVVVRDHGPGVPTHALNRLFDPFYRVDEARDRASGGIGLGLAIARQAMLAHGGDAVAENHPDGGLMVRLELPVDR